MTLEEIAAHPSCRISKTGSFLDAEATEAPAQPRSDTQKEN